MMFELDKGQQLEHRRVGWQWCSHSHLRGDAVESVVGRDRAVGEAAVVMWRPMDLGACQESAEVATGTCGCAWGVAVVCWMPGMAISGPVRMEPAPMYVSCKLLFTTRNRTGKDSSKRALSSTRYVPEQLFAVTK